MQAGTHLGDSAEGFRPPSNARPVRRIVRRALTLTALLGVGTVQEASAGSAGPGGTAASAGVVAPTACAAGTGARALTARFREGIGPLIGADYQRAFPLPDGRRLWVFQDAFIRTSKGTISLVHNVGLLQEGPCFTLLRSGTADDPRPWIAAGRTSQERRWFWPLGGTVAADGTFRLFVAEMIERGPRYLSNPEPVATWVATIGRPWLRAVGFRRAVDQSNRLYGWSVVDHGRFTYLFGHCYRQFGWSPFGHDKCAADVRVARVPRGRVFRTPTYWNGSTWSTRPRRAVSIAPRIGPRGEPRNVNPMQFGRVGSCWIAVTKVGDWFGDSIYLDRAPTPRGPWRTAAVIPAEPLGPPTKFNTFFASFISRTRTGRIVGLSNNRWDGVLSSAYRPTFRNIALSTWACPS
jgi:hypothetical protein